LNTKVDLQKFVKNNKLKVEKGTGFTRYLLVGQNFGELDQRISENSRQLDPIEYFYLEEPSVPDKYFPLKVYGIYDRITVEEQRIPRLKEDVIKILGESKKFGVRIAEPPQFCGVAFSEIMPENVRE